MITNNEEVFQSKYYQNYYVSKEGNIYSSYVVGGNGKIDTSELHMLRYSKDKNGYYRVVLSQNGHKLYKKVHTIVAEQFIRPLRQDEVVNHLDGNKNNNNISNLEITTAKGNSQHAHRIGLFNGDIRTIVIYDNNTYYFNSMVECTERFPALSKHYLNQIRKGIVSYSMILFKKENDKINAYYNGKLFKSFKYMKDADLFFNKRCGTTSSSFKSNQYRQRVNEYTVIFPNVSTIESTDNTSGSK